jgi:hypothetical protein
MSRSHTTLRSALKAWPLRSNFLMLLLAHITPWRRSSARHAPATDIKGIDDYIGQISKVDPDSYAFRYAHSKKGNRSLPPGLSQINLKHFAELIERLAYYFEGIEAAAHDLAEFKEEMEAEYWREMSRLHGDK